MKTRNPKPAKTDISALAFDEAIRRYAGAETREREINSQIEADVNEILLRYEDELSTLAGIKNSAFEIARSYCVANKDNLFAYRRSIGTTHGIAGFRLGTPRLKTLKGHTWDQVLALLREKLPAYVRTVEEPAKDLLLADRLKETVAPLLIDIGVQVVQDELFYIDARKAA